MGQRADPLPAARGDRPHRLPITPVFVGDSLNTAARIEEYAKRTGLDLVASGELLGRLALPPDVETTRCEELALRGKEARVAADGLTGTPT